ncbi:GH116 family glycosyl-hydrolase [Rathayibacter sp. KR2-224]|uniref:GH116 family glycosyl-hydrolase n=1 Tax=Rathayibacter sp. KR2-224 TaxID=3400913 RepID=UPI003C0B80FC
MTNQQVTAAAQAATRPASGAVPDSAPGRVLGPEASAAAFPLGGIGTGNVSIGARGELRDWEISNHPDKGTWLPFTFFAIRAQQAGADAVVRVLESRLRPPHEGDSGYHIGKVAGLPRLASSRLRGEYPIATVDFDDDALPVRVRLTAFTPLVPLDSDDSGIPAAVLRYTVTNETDAPVRVNLAGAMSNPIAITRHNVFQFPEYLGTPTVEFQDDGRIRGLVFGTDLSSTDMRYGTATLTTTDEVTATPCWPVDVWQDGIQLFWDAFTATGRLDASERFSLDGDDPAKLPKLRTGSISVEHELAPGESRDIQFVLAWHTPNRSKAWNGMVGLPNTHADEVVQNQYAVRYPDAWAVASDVVARLPELEAATRLFHDALYDSTLPPEVIDAVTSTLVVARSTTCFRIADGTPEGRFAAWEGSFDHAGSCEGTCTHVWNYAQTLAALFPELERNARRNEFLNETLPDGRMRFRTNSVFDAEPLEFHPAVDGQMGTIVRLYREWRTSGDDAFLEELWPAAKRALDFAFTVWDSDGDGVLDSQQHNTYDIEFYGENSLANSMFIAALGAATRIAEHLGDREAVERYGKAADTAARLVDAMLYNGEYYDQRLDDVDEHRYQYGAGCLSDQLLGQTLAHLVGIGHILPADHVRSAVGSIYRHNFRRGFDTYASVQRTYALGDEAGLVLCTWPNGGRPRIPFVYSDEVWTGIEYHVATHLVYEGMVDEALEIVRAARARHDGVRRNPWNEAECGNHYARSMASWGVLLALTGAQWDAPSGVLRLAPVDGALRDGRASFPFTAGTGWGVVELDDGGATLGVLGGRVEASSVEVVHPRLGRLTASGVALGSGQSIELDNPSTSLENSK